MHVTKFLIHLINYIFFGAFVCVCAAGRAEERKSIVSVWVIGSDIETPEHTKTINLRDIIEEKISSTSNLLLSHGEVGDIKIYIPDNVILTKYHEKNYVLLHFNLYDKNRSIEDLKTYCDEEELKNCANDVMRQLDAFKKYTIN